MGMKGAAYATVISRALGLICSLYFLIYKEKLLSLYLPDLKSMFAIWRKILYIAGPAALGMLITPVSIGLITRFVSDFGEEAVAAFGIVTRLEMFSLLIVAALGSVMTIFAGQNWGKGLISRINKAVKIASTFSLLQGIVILAVYHIFAAEISSLFNDDEKVVSIAVSYMLIVSIGYGFQGILIVAVTTLNGINMPLSSLGCTMLRMFGLYVPLAWLASGFFGLEGIFWSALASNVLSGIFSYLMLIRKLGKA